MNMNEAIRRKYTTVKEKSECYKDDISELIQQVNRIRKTSEDLGISKYRHNFEIDKFELNANLLISVMLLVIVLNM